jgi:hypothetical protein
VRSDDVPDVRRSTRTGRPTSDYDFVKKIEKLTGRMLRRQKPGPKKIIKAELSVMPPEFPNVICNPCFHYPKRRLSHLCGIFDKVTHYPDHCNFSYPLDSENLANSSNPV